MEAFVSHVNGTTIDTLVPMVGWETEEQRCPSCILMFFPILRITEHEVSIDKAAPRRDRRDDFGHSHGAYLNRQLGQPHVAGRPHG
jgi:hypothetical protein